jgi:hypothetical protein
VTFAPGTIAPDSSVTTPFSVAFWAKRFDEKKTIIAKPTNLIASAEVPFLIVDASAYCRILNNRSENLLKDVFS